MRHKIIEKLSDIHPYELLKVEIIPENEKELEYIKNTSDVIDNYLIFELDVISVIEKNYPFYIIKTLKDNIRI